MHRNQDGEDQRHTRTSGVPVHIYGVYGRPRHLYLVTPGEDWTPPPLTPEERIESRRTLVTSEGVAAVKPEELASTAKENKQ
jgi:hypothetical protein